MLKRHQFFEIYCKGREEYSHAEGSAKYRQIEARDVKTGRNHEIHLHFIGQQGHESYGEQARKLLPEHLYPEHHEHAAAYCARPFYEIEHGSGHGAEMEHARRKRVLQYLRG